MFRAAILALTFFVVSLVSAAEPDSAAMKMVNKLRLGDNMSMMAYQAAISTQTYRMIVQEFGSEKAQMVIKSELDKARPKYQLQWNKNLAASYAEFFTPQELESLTEKKKSSPFVDKFMAVQNELGASMKVKSKDVLTEFAAEAVSNAYSRLPLRR